MTWQRHVTDVDITFWDDNTTAWDDLNEKRTGWDISLSGRDIWQRPVEASRSWQRHVTDVDITFWDDNATTWDDLNEKRTGWDISLSGRDIWRKH